MASKPTCPSCSEALKKIFYPSSNHGFSTTDEHLYTEPAVMWKCPKCWREWQRWCDQPTKKRIKAGCKLHKTQLCLWESQEVRKNGNTTLHWVLLCQICRREGDKTRKKSRTKHGAVRGRCPNCGVVYTFNATNNFLV